MNQVSSRLRRGPDGYFWWCPACSRMHPLPDGWKFDGDLERPTFSPSFKHTWRAFTSHTAEGLGQGERYNAVCHYILTAGQVAYCDDSSHAMAGKTIPMPHLPTGCCGD